MRKFYLICVCIIVACMCCSCANNENGYVKSANTYGYYSSFNVSFGMPVDEVIKELNLENKDIDWLDESELSDYDYDTKAFYTDLKFYGVDSTVVFFFEGDLINNSEQVGLTRYRVNLHQNVVAQEIMDNLQQDFDKRGLEYDYTYFGNQIILYSNLKSIDDIEDTTIMEKSLIEVKKSTGKLYEEKPMGKTAGEITFDQIMLMQSDDYKVDDPIPPEKREMDGIDFMSRAAAMVGRAANNPD